jgi:hypothetical protein
MAAAGTVAGVLLLLAVLLVLLVAGVWHRWLP